VKAIRQSNSFFSAACRTFALARYRQYGGRCEIFVKIAPINFDPLLWLLRSTVGPLGSLGRWVTKCDPVPSLLSATFRVLLWTNGYMTLTQDKKKLEFEVWIICFKTQIHLDCLICTHETLQETCEKVSCVKFGESLCEFL